MYELSKSKDDAIGIEDMSKPRKGHLFLIYTYGKFGENGKYIVSSRKHLVAMLEEFLTNINCIGREHDGDPYFALIKGQQNARLKDIADVLWESRRKYTDAFEIQMYKVVVRPLRHSYQSDGIALIKRYNILA